MPTQNTFRLRRDEGAKTEAEGKEHSAAKLRGASETRRIVQVGRATDDRLVGETGAHRVGGRVAATQAKDDQRHRQGEDAHRRRDRRRVEEEVTRDLVRNAHVGVIHGKM